MTLPNANLDIATALAGASLGTLGVSLFAVAEMPQSDAIPAQAVFVQTYGGRAPEDYLGQAGGLRFTSVQVCVRGNPHDLESAQSRARAIWDALHHAVISGYMRCRCIQSAPVYLGLNDQQEPRFVVNLELMTAV